MLSNAVLFSPDRSHNPRAQEPVHPPPGALTVPLCEPGRSRWQKAGGLPAFGRLVRLAAARMALRDSPIVNARFCALLLITIAVSGTARADAVRVVTGSIGGTSDFVFRGFSLTRGKPAAQASLDVEFPREFYVGAFAATADPNAGPSPPVEVDAWAGRYWRMGENFSGDLRLSQYTYPDDPRRVSYDRTEITGTVGFRNHLFVAAVYSPNTRAVASSAGYAEGDVWALELSARHAFNDRWAVAAGVGRWGLEKIYRDDFTYWNATVTATFSPFEVQLGYMGVDSRADRHFHRDVVGERVAVTALWRFSNSR